MEGKATIRESALEFHRTVQELFRQAAVVPFRFPTILADENEISAFLAKHSSEYESALLRLRDAVQMEIRIEEREAASPPAASRSSMRISICTASRKRNNALSYSLECLARNAEISFSSARIVGKRNGTTAAWRNNSCTVR